VRAHNLESYQQKHGLINTLSILLKENGVFLELLTYICSHKYDNRFVRCQIKRKKL